MLICMDVTRNSCKQFFLKCVVIVRKVDVLIPKINRPSVVDSYTVFFFHLASLFCLYQVSSATDQWECRQGASRTTKSRRHLCGIRSMVLIWQDSIGRVGDDTQGPGQQNTITITSGCKWTLKEQRRSLRYLHRDGRILTSGLHSIMSPGVSTEFTLCHIWKGIALRYEAEHESRTHW